MQGFLTRLLASAARPVQSAHTTAGARRGRCKNSLSVRGGRNEWVRAHSLSSARVSNPITWTVCYQMQFRACWIKRVWVAARTFVMSNCISDAVLCHAQVRNGLHTSALRSKELPFQTELIIFIYYIYTYAYYIQATLHSDRAHIPLQS